MRLPVHIWIREENATPEELAGYFTELARRLDERPQKMRLVIESEVPASLDFDPKDGDPVVSVGGRTGKFCIRHRWMPEHPVPLQIGSPSEAGKRRFPFSMFRPDPGRMVLLIDPVDGNRFRVRAKREIRAPAWLYALFAVAAVAAAVTFAPVALSAAAVLLACLVSFKAASHTSGVLPVKGPSCE